MKKNAPKYSVLQRLGALCLAVLMMVTILPQNAVAAGSADGVLGTVTTVSDPSTIRRHEEVYGSDTENAGKVTVGKSVSDEAVTINYGGTSKTFTPGEDNFVVTVSQAAQVMGLATESAAPVDVVFVLDTSNSMQNRVGTMVTAANNAIKTLLQANPNNRIGVVAFSGTEGGGTSGGDAANVLSPLAHYDGAGETEHLTQKTSGWSTLLTGRGSGGVAAGTRNSVSRGTNIHAGVVCGAKLLMNATETTVDGVTRIPFLVVMSDGQPSYALDSTNWYDPDLGEQTDSLENVSGVGFLPTLAAAYYKSKITEHYFDSNANANNRCFIYTLGLGLDSLGSNNKQLALMTVDPANQTSSNNQYNTFESYWSNYQKGNSFTIETGSNDFTITAETINATKNYISTYKYNDKYFSASQVSDLNTAFSDIVTTIQKQAISSPTLINPDHGADFSGYVTFTDPIGEYMEVKDVYGLIADGNLYQGKTFAQYVSNWDSAPQAFKDQMLTVLQERCHVTGATMDAAAAAAFMKSAAASPNQAYYNSDSDYDNSIVWWGKSYKAAGEEDVQIQWLGAADNDTVEYITDPTTQIPAGADYVCRSYYFHGNAGGTVENPDHEYLHFVVRVQRSLTAPYQETVVVSAPASLLSVEQVLITEESDGTYTAAVTEAEPARVVYEVGLRSDINAFNIDEIVGNDTAKVNATQTYVQETDVAGNVVNYDASTDTYTFYTNDWDRSQTKESHHRAMTHVTFDAAENNSFYTYTEDTPVYVKNGNNYTLYTGASKPSGSSYYYARTVYDWSADTTPDANGAFTAVKRTVYIPVTIPSAAPVTQKTDGWYIPKGTHKASSLTGGEDVIKSDNTTDTSAIISHPHRTEDATNSHYTVLLGNNGKLTLKSETSKKVDVTKADNTVITDADGRTVMVGDTLTYTIRVLNPNSTATTANVTDAVPRGTEFVSAENGGSLVNGVVTWKNIRVPAATADAMGETTVSFKVKVTEAVLSGNMDVVTIDNTAYVTLENGHSYETNTTSNPPEGKKVVDTNGAPIEGNVQVPDVLVYRIRWQNDAGAGATVTITDKIPVGTTYVEGSASEADKLTISGNTLTWTFTNVAADASGVVDFRVNVNAGAQTDTDGPYVQNTATIKVNNDAEETNTPKVYLDTGDLVLSKTVTNTSEFTSVDWTAKTFTMHVHEIGEDLNGQYKIVRQVGQAPQVEDTVTFTNGMASLEIKHNETITIEGIPAGAIMQVHEEETGYNATYTVNGAAAAEGRVTITKGTSAVSVAVSNEYDPTAATFTINGEKVLTSSVPLEATTFGFTARRSNGVGVPLTGSDAHTVTGEVTVSGTSDSKTFTFSPITFTEAGTYHYLIEEINGGVSGVKYDGTKYLMNIVVFDDGNGQLEVTENTLTSMNDAGQFSVDHPNKVAEFTNTYEPQQTQLELSGTKVMTGRDARDREFSFTVKEGNTTASTGYNTDTDADGKYDEIVFAPIAFTAANMDGATTKTFTYTVTEDVSGAYGVAYSAETYRLTVTVTVNADKLEATVSKWEKLEQGQFVEITTAADQDLKFINVFTPDDVQATLSGTKILRDNNNNDISSTLHDQQFAFEIQQQNAQGEWTHVAYGNNTDNGDVDTVNNNIVFAPITYTVADLDGVTADANGIKTKTFTYRIVELIPDGPSQDPDMHYDSTAFTASVTVTYNTNTGVMAAGEPSYSAPVVFTNIVRPDHVDVPITGSKTTVDGSGNAVTGPMFSFSLMNEANTQAVSGGSAAANGKINFTNLTYTAEGTHYYWIYESNHAGQTAHGVTYSNQRFLVKVVVERDDTTKVWNPVVTYYRAGTVNDPFTVATYALDANVVVAANVTFANTYAAVGRYDVTATKTLSGNRSLGEGDFMFKLERLDTAGNVVSTLYATNTDADSDNAYDDIVFPSILFADTDLADHDNDPTTPKTATFRYRVSEVVTDDNRLPGVTYSNAQYHFTITARDNGSGGITTEVQYYTDGTYLTTTTVNELTFANAYNALTGTYAEFNATKVLQNRDLVPNEFEFELYWVEKNADGTVKAERFVDSATNMDTDGDGQYDDIYFYRSYAANTTPGTYYYYIKEVSGSLGGVEYDINGTNAKKQEIKVEIIDNYDGTLSSRVTHPANGITFTNRYTPKGTSLPLTGTKILENREAAEGEFAFDVMKQVGSQWQSVSTGYNTDTADADTLNNNIVFTDLNFVPADMWDATSQTFLTEKNFVFRVVEVQGHGLGVSYDQTVYQLTVKVTDTQGKLSADITGWEKLDAQGSPVAITDPAQQKLVFTNTYTPQSVSLQLAAKKTLNGRAMEAGEFSFVVREGINDPNGTIKATGGNAAAASGVSANVMFSNIGYALSDVGEHVYTIFEEQTGQGGVTFSTAKYAKVIVKYYTTEGVLRVDSVEYYSGVENGNLVNQIQGTDVPTFVNTYDPVNAVVRIPVDKTLINKVMEADEFTFTLQGEGTVATAKNDENGVVTFDPLTFDKVGTFTYTVSEAVTEPAKADGTYSMDNSIKVTVEVTDDLKGKLHATVSYNEITDGNPALGGVEFINYYTAPALTKNLDLEIGATKTVSAPDGITYSPAGFAFEVTDILGNVIKGRDARGNEVDMVGISGEDGKINFPDFYFDKAGEYHFWISEKIADKEGVLIDGTVWELHILVRYNNVTGELCVDAEDVLTYRLSRIAGDGTEKPVFVNTYMPTEATLHLTAKKILNGRDLKNREFAFYLMEGELIAAEGYNDVDGNIRFTVTYGAADLGKHTYKVVERQGSAAGVIYDTKEYASVTVEVKDDQTTGKLVAYLGQQALENNATVSTGVTVTNTYAADGVAVVTAYKELTGKSLAEDQFSFQLVNTADEEESYTATNTADGVITFQIPCEAAGQVTYKLSEVKGTDAKVTYDSKTYTVTVTTTDDGNGKLHAQVKYDTADGNAPTFTNVYTPDPVGVKLSGTKKLEGRDMVEGEFKFEVRDKSGALVSYALNDAKGNLNFSEIKFAAAGTYTLTVAETAGSAANVTYDETKFQVVVEVTNEDGVLKAEVEGPAGGILFVNTYKDPSNPTVPDTGDHSNVTLYVVLAAVSFAVCVILIVLDKKSKKRA